MKIEKKTVIEIDVAGIRARYLRPDIAYTDEERAKLVELTDLFAAGKFREVIKLADGWGRDTREMIDGAIWDVLYGMVAECRPHVDGFKTETTTWSLVDPPATLAPSVAGEEEKSATEN